MSASLMVACKIHDIIFYSAMSIFATEKSLAVCVVFYPILLDAIIPLYIGRGKNKSINLPCALVKPEIKTGNTKSPLVRT